MLNLKGPLLIAANHPNSFLDAIILATLFKSPIYSLARGDAFASKIITRLLGSFNMLPVYRVSEGVENLENNYDTFKMCQNIFKQDGIVLIFSEGRCINEWHLRPLKKGTARLALEAWKSGVNLKILPLGINYSCFKKFGKTVVLNFGNFITNEDVERCDFAGKEINDFNEKLRAQLKKLVFEIDINDYQERKKIFSQHISFLKKLFLFIPAILGFVLHLPLYFGIHLSIKNKAEDHYDSVVTGLLFFTYPVYITVMILILFFITGSFYSLLLIVLLPFCLWSYVQLKKPV
ncbi:MAG: 1-acyl-sn-glycerol-3-phosphate acyltransferase [Ginsengibacter sp.]